MVRENAGEFQSIEDNETVFTMEALEFTAG